MSGKTLDKSGLRNINITEVSDMRDHSKDPVFIEKNKKATTFLLKHGLPKDVEKKVKR